MRTITKSGIPLASKYLITELYKKGADLKEIPGVNGFLVKFKNKEYFFLNEFTPLTPYMYGVVFTNQKYWFEILKDLKVRFSWEPKKKQKKITFLITKDGFYNALLEKSVSLFGNGTKNLADLIKEENLNRINSGQKWIMPIKTSGKKLRLSWVPKTGEEITLKGPPDLIDISSEIDKSFIPFAERIINFLPGLSFLRFELFVEKPERIDRFTLGKVLVSPGSNIFPKITDGKKFRDTKSILLKYMADSF